MLNETQARDAIGTTAYTQSGDKIGKVGQLYLNDSTGQPEFVTVNTGLFGMKESFVPVTDATLDGDRLTVPFTKDQIKDAPSIDVDGGHLDEAEEARLWQHYAGHRGQHVGHDTHDTHTTDTTVGHDATAGHHTAGTDSVTTGRAPVGHDTSGRTTDEAMTRSEEHVEVGTTTQEAGRARLRKYVTTEHVTQTVPVRKEHAVLETEPITEANAGQALDGPTISEEEHEVVLHEEKPVVQKTAEPVERVRLGTETVVDEETVGEDVRKEHIEVEGDVADRRH
ncbi:PRC and DUF2382 domain-containing protein [Nocardioides sp. ChNu-153]|uniref:PRC and DUF2382 domain-containing protein n=1 Tax=unclassified Nocardioides TaxID=2615069 RepID=UPI0024057662|nr:MULTISPECIES: PRC and DUF2382 domain-containing protein [unclassified Nocardioides]MDF9716886.1 PRC and DUF2382 domain-containing protein [Nocardioides sp. ChNu-99]MDN7123170.1 PRC and DUF2382 domain-containing protein [Nocardioides sp. ChNu-153]